MDIFMKSFFGAPFSYSQAFGRLKEAHWEIGLDWFWARSS